MSSLAATQADGYYVPPEYYESGVYKKQSKSQFNHPNQKGHNQYLQRGVVRFELPYKGICTKCQTSIGRGTRYNAHKTKTSESYFTTPIYEFTMTCRTAGCSSTFIIRTNPQERGFDYCQGITIQKGQEYQLDGAAAVTVGGASSSSGALEKLEARAQDKRLQMTEHDQLVTLQNLNQKTTFLDADVNATVRAKFRSERREKKARIAEGAAKGWRHGMELLSSIDSDRSQSKSVVYGKQPQERERDLFHKVRTASIFNATSKQPFKRRKRSVKPSSILGIDPSQVMSNTRVPSLAVPSITPANDEPIPTPVLSSRMQPNLKKSALETSSDNDASCDPSTKQHKKERQYSSAMLADLFAGYGSSSEADE